MKGETGWAGGFRAGELQRGRRLVREASRAFGAKAPAAECVKEEGASAEPPKAAAAAAVVDDEEDSDYDEDAAVGRLTSAFAPSSLVTIAW